MESKETKKDLIAKGKEYGLNLKASMSMYELKARIKEYEDSKKGDTPAKKSKAKDKGEY